MLNSNLQIIVVIILQDTYISNHHTVYLELTQSYMLIFFSMTLERKIKCRGKFQKNFKKKLLIIQAEKNHIIISIETEKTLDKYLQGFLLTLLLGATAAGD